MTRPALSSLARAAAVAAAVTSLAACNTLTRLSEVGSGPEVSNIQNPNQKPGYTPVSMPMPSPMAPPQGANSLWRAGARAFFKDQRAKDVGDILTVSLSVNDTVSFTTSLDRTRTGAETANATNLLGYEGQIAKFLPQGANPSSLLNLGSTSSAVSAGSTGRTEQMTTNIAATVTQVLPNGNLVISGRQEMKVNYEMRELTIRGIIRPEDLSTSNTVTYDKIAEARIYYGGRGVASDVSQPRYGQQLLDIIFPF